jgi:predicted NAD-dependent protein-ADP-ribosyltransferase YbiA (DUF1768 family)
MLRHKRRVWYTWAPYGLFSNFAPMDTHQKARISTESVYRWIFSEMQAGIDDDSQEVAIRITRRFSAMTEAGLPGKNDR